MEIQPANLLDLGALRKLERACFEKDAWPLLDLVAVLSFPDVVRLKAVEDGAMIGFAAGETRLSQGANWIATIAVDPRFQRRGVGRALLHACEAGFRSQTVKLTVRISNQGAIALYEKEGYHTVDLWRKYYRDGEDGLVMEKAL
ncbi:MAG: GNAT family N-acetyltransferase [Anaerolineales bacterium]|nr:GNAT family N-acetyltransferase [Anaerolineales bacterium]